MTDEVTVNRADLALAIGDLPQYPRAETVEAYARLRAALAPPPPTLEGDLAAALCGDGNPYCEQCLMDVRNELLPVVEAAVAEAADQAWNAALDAAETTVIRDGTELAALRRGGSTT